MVSTSRSMGLSRPSRSSFLEWKALTLPGEFYRSSPELQKGRSPAVTHQPETGHKKQITCPAEVLHHPRNRLAIDVRRATASSHAANGKTG